MFKIIAAWRLIREVNNSVKKNCCQTSGPYLNKSKDFVPHFRLYCFSCGRAFTTVHDASAWWRQPWFWSRWRDDVEHTAWWRHHAGSGSESVLAPPRACVMYCRERTSTRETVETKMWNKIVIFVFFEQKLFLWLCKITLNPWCYMDYFTNLLAMFLDMGTFQLCCCLWRVWELSDSNKNILICVPTMNGGLTGLEQHQGE